MEKLQSRETIAVYRMLLGAQAHRLHNGLKDTYRREEYRIRDQLSQSLTTEGVNHVARTALEHMAIGGVNVYRFNRVSTYLKSMEREALQGTSRYTTAQPIIPGEKKHFIHSGTDVLLVDRFNLSEFSDADHTQTIKDFESDLRKYFGENYASIFANRIEALREALRYNLYIKYPGYEKFDMIIMANQHVKNAQRVLNGEAPLPLFRSKDHEEILVETLRSIQTSVTSELIKAELMRIDKLQLSRAEITHDLHLALDRIRDQGELFELLLTNLPAQFMRNEQNTFIHRSSIMLFEEDEGVLRISASRNIHDSQIKATGIKPGEGIAGEVFRTGQAMLENDTKGSFMSVPIKFEDKVFGVLNVRSKHTQAFKIEDLQHLETLASILASKMRITGLMTMDGLTKVLYQRRWGVERLNSMLEEAKKRNTALAFIMFDADHFKWINDNYSHGFGDSVLIGIASAIHRFILAHKELFEDHVEIRWGGEELVIGLLGSSIERANEIAEGLREEIKKQKFIFNDKGITVTASAGVAVYPLHGESVELLANNADRALYSSKRTTRDRVTVYDPNDPEMNEIALP